MLGLILSKGSYQISIINISLFIILSVVLFIFRYIYPKKKINLIFLFTLISILPMLSLFRPGTFEAGGTTVYSGLLFSFFRNLQDHIFLPRWAGDLYAGYGAPVFLTDYILPFYFGSFFVFLGFSYLMSVKLVFAFSYIISGFTMYLWGKDELGKKGGIIAAIFYLFAPYHLLQVHFNGSIGAIPAFIFIPLLFLFAKKFIETKNILFFFAEAVNIVLFIMCHPIYPLLTIPLALVYGIFVWARKKKKSSLDLLFFFGSVIYGFILSSFYWLPAIEEAKYTWLGTSVHIGNFTNLLNHLYSPIAFGFLNQGHRGELYFTFGYTHIAAFCFFVYLFLKKKIEKKHFLLSVYLLLSTFFLLFMMTPMSAQLWRKSTLLSIVVEGVDRLLAPIAFISSAIAGIAFGKLKDKWVIIICYITIVISILNWANRKMVPIVENPALRVAEYYTEYIEWHNPIYLQRMKGDWANWKRITTYQWQHPRSGPLEFLSGQGQVKQVSRTQIKHEYIVYVEKDAMVRENTHYFLGWKVTANNINIPINYINSSPGSFGFITFALKKGLYLVDVDFTDTKIRVLSAQISLFSFLAGIAYLFIFFKLKRKNS